LGLHQAARIGRARRAAAAGGAAAWPLQMNWNTESLEPIQQVVGQQDDLEEGLVGPEILCRDLAQGVGVFQFSNDQFRSGSLVVEAPQMQRRQLQVGHQELIAVAAHLKQVQLSGRLFGHRAADDHEASRAGPALRTIPKFRGPHAGRHPAVEQSRQSILERSAQPSHDHVKCAFPLDKFDNLVIKERSIGSNSYLSNQLWQFGEGTLQQRDRDRRDVGVAGMVAALPTILRVPLEAQQGKVRGAPALLGL